MERSASPPAIESDGKLRIVAAARPLFVSDGYKGVSMQQIADAAGIHKATLYHHFKDKDDLFVTVLNAELATLRQGMVQAIEQESTTAGRLRALAWTFLQHTHGDFSQLMADVQRHLPEDQRQAVMRNQAFPWEQMEHIFQQANDPLAEGTLDVRLATTLFAGLVWGQIWARKVGRETEPITEDIASRTVDILLTGLLTSPAARIPTEDLASIVEP